MPRSKSSPPSKGASPDDSASTVLIKVSTVSAIAVAYKWKSQQLISMIDILFCFVLFFFHFY